MAEQVNIGVIGTSWWADMFYLPILQSYERANLVAICGRNRERADEMAKKFAVPQIYTDYQQMIQSANLDAIIVATPDDTHYEMVMAGLDTRLHVLCEKPIALNADHARLMSNKAQAVGVKHMVMYTWHWLPNFQRVKQLLDANYIGKVYHGYIHWLSSYGGAGAYQWRYDTNRANGIVSDLGSHLIHLALWLLGDVVAVTGHLGFHVEREGANGEPSNPANDSAMFTLEFVNGAQVQFFITALAYVLNGHLVSVALHGANGMLEASSKPAVMTSTTFDTQQHNTDTKLSEKTQVDFVEFFKTNPVGIRLFVDSILDNKPSTPGLYEGYKVQQIIDAVIQSHQSGCRVIISPTESK